MVVIPTGAIASGVASTVGVSVISLFAGVEEDADSEFGTTAIVDSLFCTELPVGSPACCQTAN